MARPRRVTRQQLSEIGACGVEFDAFCQQFGESVEPTWAAFDEAYGKGLNLVWLYVRILPAVHLAPFVALTVNERQEALRALLGGDAVDADIQDVRAKARAFMERWQETGDRGARSLAIALGDLADDRALSKPTPDEAERAVRHCLRTVSMAGMEEEPVRRRLSEWLAEKQLGFRP